MHVRGDGHCRGRLDQRWHLACAEVKHGAIEVKRLQADSDMRERENQAGAERRDFNQIQVDLPAAAPASFKPELGDARAHSATLSRDRQCLGAGTVRMLTNIGKPAAGDVQVAAGQPDGVATSASGSVADRADALATSASETPRSGELVLASGSGTRFCYLVDLVSLRWPVGICSLDLPALVQ